MQEHRLHGDDVRVVREGEQRVRYGLAFPAPDKKVAGRLPLSGRPLLS
jgi:hypothetical protein